MTDDANVQVPTTGMTGGDSEIPNSVEYVMVWDEKNDNPNGDMRNMNKPRRDDITGQLEIRDARLKRYLRDEWIASNLGVLVQARYDESGNTLSCENSIKPVKEDIKLSMGIKQTAAGKKGKKDEDEGNKKAIPGLRRALLEELAKKFIDVRLFGVVVTDASKELGSTCALLAPLHINWTKSVNATEAKAVKGTSCFSSGEEMGGGNISGQWVVPYSLFKSSAVFYRKTAKRQGIKISEADLAAFRNGFINGLTNYKSTSKNPMPRLFIEVVYKNDAVDGELDELVDANYSCSDEELRSISQVTFDFAKLKEYCTDENDTGCVLKDNIKAVNVYARRDVNYINSCDAFKVITF